jgi:hypothetical protein
VFFRGKLFQSSLLFVGEAGVKHFSVWGGVAYVASAIDEKKFYNFASRG